MNTIAFRNEKPEDYRAVENLVRESFWNVYRPGCLEHYASFPFKEKLKLPGQLE